MAAPQEYELVLVRDDGQRARPRHVLEDPDQPWVFRQHLLGIARIAWPELTDSGQNWIADFEIEVWRADHGDAEPRRIYRFRKE